MVAIIFAVICSISVSWNCVTWLKSNIQWFTITKLKKPVDFKCLLLIIILGCHWRAKTNCWKSWQGLRWWNRAFCRRSAKNSCRSKRQRKWPKSTGIFNPIFLYIVLRSFIQCWNEVEHKNSIVSCCTISIMLDYYISQKFGKCFLGKIGFIDSKGDFQENVAIEKLSKGEDRAKIEEIVKQCKSVIGQNKDENPIKLYACYLEKKALA